MDSLLILGCGGAGVKFLNYVREFTKSPMLGINDASGDIRVSREKMEMVDSVHGDMFLQVYPWLREIRGENIMVLAGLGGVVGTNLVKLIGSAIGKRKNLHGVMVEPFSFESSVRKERAESIKESVERNYRSVIYLANDPLAKYYSALKMEESMKIHPIIMGHYIKDFERMILKNSMNFGLSGVLGIGIGFGVGRERIRLAVEDAMDSPWLADGRRAVFISGNADREDVEVVMSEYDIEFWDFYSTEEYGEKIKATVISKNKKIS